MLQADLDKLNIGIVIKHSIRFVFSIHIEVLEWDQA
jgi:hypothetical protein